MKNYRLLTGAAKIRFKIVAVFDMRALKQDMKCYSVEKIARCFYDKKDMVLIAAGLKSSVTG